MAAAAAASSPPPRPTVAVFGASWAAPDSSLYTLSVDLGAALAAAGFDVISGGYLGTMEGVSRGATASGGSATGVLVPSLFPGRDARGNDFLTRRVDAPSLLARIDTILAEAPRLLVALPGTLGTATEIFCAWNNAMLCQLRGATPPKIICFREPWEVVLTCVLTGLKLGDDVAKYIVYVDSAEECVRELLK